MANKAADARALQAAIDEGEPADVQYGKLVEEALNCYEAADKIQGLNAKVDAFAACQGIYAKASFILAHAAAIDSALGIPSTGQIDAWATQASFDKRYDAVYTEYRNKSPAEIEQAYEQVVGQAASLSRAAALAALIDLKNHKPWHPPHYDPNAPLQVPTPPEPSETPDTGATPEPGQTAEPLETSDAGDSDQMTVSAMRRRPQDLASRYPQKLVKALMPLSDYWLVDTPSGPTLHFIEDCPACVASGAEAQELDEAEHPLALADRLDAHPCGTCMRMAEASIKDGFLTGGVAQFKTIAFWRDRVEYEGPVWLGMRREQVTIARRDILGASFSSPTDLVLSTAQRQFKFSFSRPVDGDLACEALRRLGVNIDEG